MYVLGIDLGTSSLKGVLINELGEVIVSISSSYPLIHKKKGWSEQHPIEWINAFKEVITTIMSSVPDAKKNIEGLAISGQMHGLVLLDENGEVLRPAILWNDTRTTDECNEIMTCFADEIVNTTKNRALEGFTLPKILWIKKNEPNIWSKSKYIMLPKDYLVWWLTGVHATDYSDAAGTLMLDLEEKKWSELILEKYNIDRKQLPKLYESIECVGKIKEDVLREFSISKEIKVMAGGADNACSAVGAGIINNDVGLISIGTSGVVLSYEDNLNNDYNGKIHVFNHGVPNKFYSMGVTLAAGHSLSWFKNTFAPNESFESLLKGIENIPCGSEGLIFTPYIVGERTPYTDSKIRGSFTGVDTRHTLKHFTRSVLEGITFSLKDCYEFMGIATDKSFKTMVTVGGGSKNKEWLQMQADIFDMKIRTLQVEEGPGFGAALIASVGINWFDSIEEAVQHCVKYKDEYIPKLENMSIYAEKFTTYKKLYSILTNIK